MSKYILDELNENEKKLLGMRGFFENTHLSTITIEEAIKELLRYPDDYSVADFEQMIYFLKSSYKPGIFTNTLQAIRYAEDSEYGQRPTSVPLNAAKLQLALVTEGRCSDQESQSGDKTICEYEVFSEEESIVCHFTKYDKEEDAYYEAAFLLPVAEFLKMNQNSFENAYNSGIYYNLQPTESFEKHEEIEEN